MNLNDIARKYGTDKSNSQHGYIRIYEKYLSNIRNNFKNILEIGVREGWSHKMWYDYFPNSMIYGVDNYVDPASTNTQSVENDRIKIFVGDQEDEDFLNESFQGELDLIIDDGGHRMSQQQNTLRVMFPKLKKGSYYIIEDLHTSKDRRFGDYDDKKSTTLYFLENITNIKDEESYYIKGEELKYIQENVKSVSFFCNKKLCIIEKK
jgi:hypothetical protein